MAPYQGKGLAGFLGLATTKDLVSRWPHWVTRAGAQKRCRSRRGGRGRRSFGAVRTCSHATTFRAVDDWSRPGYHRGYKTEHTARFNLLVQASIAMPPVL